ncbi:MAG: hypothetical protein WDA22_16365 [Bacteroidota bacterium]
MQTTPSANIKTVLSNEGGQCIELLHYKDDPSVWIIRSSKKLLGYKTKTSTVWFASEQQALTFAHKQADENRLKRANAQ